MSVQVIEGTWEEIKLREADLVGRHLRVIATDEPPAARTPWAADAASGKPKVLRAQGAFKGKFGGTEETFANKRAEIELEDRRR